MIDVRPLTRDEVAHRLDELAALRLALFREWPYLCESDLDYERAYLTPYLHRSGARVIGALHENRLVGAATALPMEIVSHDFSDPFAGRPEPLGEIYFGGAALLLPMHRGRGVGRAFLRLREAQAQAMGRRFMTLCSVVRPAAHPARPANAGEPGADWRQNGYAPVPGLVARLDWRDRGADRDTRHVLQFWMRRLF